MAKEQNQFLEVVDRDTAERLWRVAICPLEPRLEWISIQDSLGRILAEDIVSNVDVPGFDRSNVDGYSIISEESYQCSEEVPKIFVINEEEITPGIVPKTEIMPGTVSLIATGGMIPRGADAVVMIEHTKIIDNQFYLSRPVSPGSNISYAGTDIACGELTLISGTLLTARETGLLSAIGCSRVPVYSKPRVGVISSGNEIVRPGDPLLPGQVYDANFQMLSDSIRENGGEPIDFGVIPDDYDQLKVSIQRALAQTDLVLLSGGTSKGNGDLSYQSLKEMQPGIVVHGVALKPGKPICLGASGKIPIAVLPGFPTSAIFTFHEFVAPVIRELAGLKQKTSETVQAIMSARINSERGRTEYLLVGLMPGPHGLMAYPMGKGSGSVTTFSRADGFIVISRHQEYIESNETVEVVRIGLKTKHSDLVVIGSHCIGLDFLLSQLARTGITIKTLWVGSQGGLDAASRGECDIAGTHLLDPHTDQYNIPFLPSGLNLIKGYGRMQGIVFRGGDKRFQNQSPESAIAIAVSQPDCRMVSRNRGSGTRVLIDQWLKGKKPPGYSVEVRSHHAVAASVIQGRADWGMTIEPVARKYNLEFIPVREEHYDFAIGKNRYDSNTIKSFIQLLKDLQVQHHLQEMGFAIHPETGSCL